MMNFRDKVNAQMLLAHIKEFNPETMIIAAVNDKGEFRTCWCGEPEKQALLMNTLQRHLNKYFDNMECAHQTKQG